MALFSLISGFNGLYGQDAHEYLHLSRAYYGYLFGQPYVATDYGDSEFAVGYPLAAALLRLVFQNDIVCLQLVSWVAAGISVFYFDRLLRLLTPGARRQSRWFCTGILLVLSPYFVRSGLTSMSDMLGLALTLAAFYYGIRRLEFERGKDAVWAAFFCALAVITRFSAAPLLLPLAISVAWSLASRRHWQWSMAAGLAGFIGLLPHILLKMNVPQSALGHSLLQEWSLLHLFHSSFTTVNGTVDYGWPNGLYILFPLIHPGFFLLLGLLFLLVKRTDFQLPVKRLLLVCLPVHLIFLGGIPHQNLRYLLLDYVLILLLLFPAWDRFISYGFHFLNKRWMHWALGFFVVLQVFSIVKILKPTLQRNKLERHIAETLQQTIPSGATLYAFDLDVSLKSYVPDLKHQNLWEKRYLEFPKGSYILFNEARLRPQWQGQNPILNWDYAREHYDLQEIKILPEGWGLFEVRSDK